MKFCILSSGSSGNCFYIESDDTAILIDIGLSYKTLIRNLSIIKRNISNIKALFITHEHSDHIKGLRSFIKTAGIPVFINSKSKLYLDIALNEHEELLSGKTVDLDGISIMPVSISHDAANTFGFKVTDKKSSLFLASDIGSIDENIVEQARGAHAIAIESNHDIDMLKKSEYPQYLKKRISGRFGHLSNDSAADFIERSATDSTKNVFFLHLSQNNNSPGLIEQIIESRLSGKFPDTAFHISCRDKPSELFDL